MDVPLILTLELDPNAFAFFNALRKIYFPPERNLIDAHLTLFHFLPQALPIVERVEALSAACAPFQLEITEPYLLGNGVAYLAQCPPLARMHAALQGEWAHFLIPQDKQKLRPHITVQNKVPSEEAKELLKFLKENFGPFSAEGRSLQLWEYHGGPWKLHRSFPLRGRPEADRPTSGK
jgi:2'-5' RNA ligase